MPPHKKSLYLLKNTLGTQGGLEKYTWRIAQGFAKKQCHVTIVSSDPSPQDHFSSLQFKTLPAKSSLSVLKLHHFDRQCMHLFKKEPCDLIFGMDRNSFQTHLRAGNGVHKAFLERRRFLDSFAKRLTVPINPLHRLILNIEKKAFEHPGLKKLFTNSQMVKDEILTHYNTPKEKIHVIHNGVEWHEWEKDFETWVEKKAKIASSLELDPSKYHFLFVGHGYKRKGLHILLKALSLLSNRDVHLSVIGKDKQMDEYIRLSEELSIQKQVSFFGRRSDIMKFYQLCDCLVIPSFYDPFANVTVEALAMGLFVISSKDNGGHEVLQESTGITLETLKDPSCLLQAMKLALDRPKTFIRSQTVRESVKHLDFSHQIGTLVDLSLQDC